MSYAPRVVRRRDLGVHLSAAVAAAQVQLSGDIVVRAIDEDVTFVDWCERIAKDRTDPLTGKPLKGLRVDGQPFTLTDRPTMRWVYEQMPSTLEEARNQMIVLRKCAQVGFTVMELLFAIFAVLKFEPLRFGLFLPGAALARDKSSRRFLRVVHSIPEAHARLTTPDPAALGRCKSGGNVMTRPMGDSVVHFLWTSGKATTESHPMDMVSFDEVQEMLIADIEKVAERMSASRTKFTLMGSTANWPEADIDYWYKLGSQWRFHTRCPTCGVEEPLDDYFPQCIKFDPAQPDPGAGVPGEYRYVCRAGHWIDDPQAGTWAPDSPDADLRGLKSIHFHQMLSPTITAREMYEKYETASDMKNFFNRKLGKPYQDPSQVPVTLAHLNACATEGMRRGLMWKGEATETFMGIDQMGAFNVVIIKERLPDNRQAVVHVEAIYDENPFARCDELMELYGVRVCVVEQLPNVNDAIRFANRHPGRVFLCNSYKEMDDVLRWSNSSRLDASQRRTDEDERTRWTVSIDRYKAMSLSLGRITETKCLFPDPQGLVQEVRNKDTRFKIPILKDMVFLHLMKVALVTEPTRTGKLRRQVKKIGIDPHAAFANMLCDVAWARAHGTATFLIDDGAPLHPTAPDQHPVAHLIRHRQSEGTCGGCANFKIKDGSPGEHGAGVCAFHSTGANECTVQDIDPENGCYGYNPQG